MPFGNSEFAKATINLESNKQGPITPDGRRQLLLTVEAVSTSPVKSR